jgi:hypothetical protein
MFVADEAVLCGPPSGEQCTVPDALAPASVVLSQICEVINPHWGLLIKSLVVLATSGAWHALLPQGLPIERRSPVSAVTSDPTVTR